MIILKCEKIKTKTSENIKKYEKIDNHGPLKCPYCEATHLVKWGKYKRNAYFINEIDKKIDWIMLDVQRYMCKDCGSTHGVLPEGLIPYKQFSIEIIIEVLSNSNKMCINQIINNLSFETIKKWQKQFKKFLPYLITMYKTLDKAKIFLKIKKDIIKFYEEFYYMYGKIFMQIKLLCLNLCHL